MPQQGSPHDAELAQKICKRLEENQFVEQSRIHVDSHDGFITLEGIVENRFSRERAAQLAMEVDGVRSIDNRIHVQREEDASGGPILTVQD